MNIIIKETAIEEEESPRFSMRDLKIEHENKSRLVVKVKLCDIQNNSNCPVYIVVNKGGINIENEIQNRSFFLESKDLFKKEDVSLFLKEHPAEKTSIARFFWTRFKILLDSGQLDSKILKIFSK